MIRRALGAIVLSVTLSSTGVLAQHHTARKPAQRLRVTATAYCDGGKTDGGPAARRGMIAADPRVLPMGSVVRLQIPSRQQYDGTYTVMDTGSAVKGHRVDIFMPSCPEAKKFGERPAIARMVRRRAVTDVGGVR